MPFVRGYTGDASTQIAVDATRTRMLLHARNRFPGAKPQKDEELPEILRSEVLRFATFFRHAAADDISRHDPFAGIYEGQRFENWMKLNDTPVLSSFQDKVFLQSTHEAAIHVMRDSSANLPPDEVVMIKRLAVVEDVLPMADEYRRWKQVLAVARRYAVLFNGMPGILLALLCALVVPAAMAGVISALRLASPPPGLPDAVADALTITLSVVGVASAVMGLAGPFVRASIAAGLRKKLPAIEAFVTSRVTSKRARAALESIHQKVAALDSRFATQRDIPSDQLLASIRTEAAFLHAKLATRHLTLHPPACQPSTSSSITPNASSASSTRRQSL